MWIWKNGNKSLTHPDVVSNPYDWLTDLEEKSDFFVAILKVHYVTCGPLVVKK